MIVKKLGENFFLRIDKDEEIVAKIKSFCEINKIKSGLISGLGSVASAELGLFDIINKKYIKKELSGIFEIASMNGNISEIDGKPYLHIHAVLSDIDCNTYGGHFASGIVGATCEIIVTPFNGEVGRFFSDEIGLNLLDI